MHARSIALLLGSFLMAGCAATTPPIVAESAATARPAGKASIASPDAGPVYRLDFVVSSGDGGKAATSSTYTINLEENHVGDIRMGANVPLTPQGNARQDVGLKLHCIFKVAGDDLVLRDDMEMSALEEPSTIRKITASGTVVVAPGKPALVASAEDVATHRRYQVMVTATKLR